MRVALLRPSLANLPAMAAASLLSGERVVVLIFLVCIISSLPNSLLLHGVVLFLIGIAALSVEMLVESYPPAHFPFLTRSLASSGIFLGAVTLPGVMLSRLIQLSRSHSFNDVAQKDFIHQGILYWTAIVSSFILLMFLCLLACRMPKKSSIHILWRASICLTFFACACSILVLSYRGAYDFVTFLWFIFHGLVAVFLLRHLLLTFPSCASIGEALLATVGLVLYFGDMSYSFSKLLSINEFLDSTQSVLRSNRRSEINVIIQGILFGLLIFPVIFKSLVQLADRFTCTVKLRLNDSTGKSGCLMFFLSLGILLMGIVPYWMQLVHDFQMHPFLWVATFVFSEPSKRLFLCIYWFTIILVAVRQFYHISKHSKIERILLRKYYHLMAVLMFLPAVIFQQEFLTLAFGVALATFLVLEIIRVWRIWPLGQLVHQFMNAFTDHRDSELLIVSHFSLLLGCALPIWISSGYNDRPLSPFAGILSLGIGDTMASIIGHKYGILRWSKSGKKTVEGTAAGMMSVLATCSVLLLFLAYDGYIFAMHWGSLLMAIFVSGLLEAYTAQLDNAFIPLVFYSLLCL